ncbi:MAG: hypothetical protein M1812_005879 [Candelaria pacifica]|nr:MAG: hypothetical protein M1812_005879 [Candelaria pacifica]
MPFQEAHSQDSRQLQDIADFLGGSRKVVVITGAGISTNCGIPDFRSENGLYALIQEQYDLFASQRHKTAQRLTRSTSPENLKVKTHGGICAVPSNVKGKDLFDAALWKSPTSTSVFYTFIASLRRKIRDKVKDTTTTHKFIRALRDGGRLVRCYTQNIDGLEERDGFNTDMARGKGVRTRFIKRVMEKPRPDGPMLPGSEMDGGCEVVELHGDLRQLRCNLCQSLCSWEDDGRETNFLSGEAPPCPACVSKSGERQGRGKRGTVIGSLRPNIVLYGEEHPAAQLLAPITTHDLSLAPEILLIMGTSLKVHGLKNLVREFAKAVHARAGKKGKVIFVNLTKPAESVWGDVLDYWVGMDCDAWVDDLNERRGDLWLRQGELKLPVVKDIMPSKGKVRQPKSIIENEEEGTALTTISNEADKENVAIRPESLTMFTSPKKKPFKKTTGSPRTGSKRRISKPTSNIAKSRLASLSNASCSAKGLEDLLLKPPMTSPPPNTPSRKVNQRNTLSQQLPTPPNSGRSWDKVSRLAKRACEALYDEDDTLQSTPTKRRKQEVRVWVDPDAELGNDRREEHVHLGSSQDSAWIRKQCGDKSSSILCNRKLVRPSLPQLTSSRPTETFKQERNTFPKKQHTITVEIPQKEAFGTSTVAPSLHPSHQLPVTNAANLRDFSVAFVDSRPFAGGQMEKLDLRLPANISWADFNIKVTLALGNSPCQAFSDAKACEVTIAPRKRPYRFSIDPCNHESKRWTLCTQKSIEPGIIKVIFHA